MRPEETMVSRGRYLYVCVFVCLWAVSVLEQVCQESRLCNLKGLDAELGSLQWFTSSFL